jgi:hypothetical protein
MKLISDVVRNMYFIAEELCKMEYCGVQGYILLGRNVETTQRRRKDHSCTSQEDEPRGKVTETRLSTAGSTGFNGYWSKRQARLIWETWQERVRGRSQETGENV